MATASWQAMEEWVDSRRCEPSFARAAAEILPLEYVLLTAEPTQCVQEGLLKRVFVLGYRCRDAQIVTHVQEHLDRSPDDVQIRYALEQFQARLQAAQLV